MKTKLQLLSLFLTLSTLVAHGQDGTIDLTFNTTGYNNYSNSGSVWDLNFSAGLQSTGKIITCGQSSVGTNNARLLLARYNQNGVIDSTFGTSGVVRTTVATSTNFTTGISCKILPDDKILVTGLTSSPTNTRSIYLARFSADGVLDTSFNSPNGFVRIEASLIIHEVHDLEVMPNGKIVVTGYFETLSQPNPVIARVNPNGTLDNTFGVNGIYTTSNFFMRSFDSKTLPDGSVYTVGTIGSNFNDLLCLKLKNNGQPDSTFGVNGRATIDLISNFSALNQHAIEILADRSVILGATLRVGASSNPALDDFAFVKLTPKGTLDPSFGTNGVSTIDLQGSTDALFGLVAMDNGKIVAGGYSNPSGNTTEAGNDFAIIRINSNGALDASFGDLAGRTIVNVGARDNLYRISVQADGKLVIPGYSVISTKGNAAVTRFNNTGQPISTYAPIVRTSNATNVQATSAQIQVNANAMGTASTVQVQYSTSSNFSSGNSITSGFSIGSLATDSTVVITLSGLPAGTGYYFRAIASNSAGSDTGSVSSFFFNNVIPSDSLTLWLRADLGVLTTGSTVNQWLDFSGKSNNVSQVTSTFSPILANNAINGLPAIRFDGTNDFLSTSNIVNLTNGPSIFIVAKNDVRKDYNAYMKMSATHTESTSAMELYWQAGTSGSGNLLYVANRPASGNITGLARGRSYANVGTVNVFQLISTIVATNTAVSGFLQGASLTNGTDIGTGVFKPQSSNKLHIGVIPGGSSFLDGDIAEIIVYNRPLNFMEITQIEGYLNQKYKVLPKLVNFQPVAFSKVSSTTMAANFSINTFGMNGTYQVQYTTGANFNTFDTLPTTTFVFSGNPTDNFSSNIPSPVRYGLYKVRIIVSNASRSDTSEIREFMSTNIGFSDANLRAWIRADGGVISNPDSANRVASVSNLRPNSLGLVSFLQTNISKQPTIVSGAINGHPAIGFNPQGNALVSSDQQALQNFTITLVFKASGSLGMVYEHGTDANTAGSYMTTSSGNTIFVRRSSQSSGYNLTSNWAGDNTYRIVTHRHNGSHASNQLWINGQQQTLSNVLTQNPNANYQALFHLGARNQSSNYMVGQIAEVIINGSYLQGADLDSLHGYLAQRYNIGLVTGLSNELDTDLNEVQLWPNPMQSFVNISIPSSVGGKANIKLIGMTGAVQFTKIESLNMGQNLLEINTEDIRPGIYVLEIEVNGLIQRKKLVKD